MFVRKPLFVFEGEDGAGTGAATATDTSTETTAEETTATAAEATQTEPEKVTLTKAEVDALRRKVAEGEKARRDAEKAKADADRKALEEQGKHQEIAAAEKARADLAEENLAKSERTSRITATAARLKFRNANDAVALLAADADLSTDASTEAALSALATERPYLIDTGNVTRTGTPASGEQQQGTVTMDTLKTMTAEQIAALPEDVLRKAMTQG